MWTLSKGETNAALDQFVYVEYKPVNSNSMMFLPQPEDMEIVCMVHIIRNEGAFAFTTVPTGSIPETAEEAVSSTLCGDEKGVLETWCNWLKRKLKCARIHAGVFGYFETEVLVYKLGVHMSSSKEILELCLADINEIVPARLMALDCVKKNCSKQYNACNSIKRDDAVYMKNITKYSVLMTELIKCAYDSWRREDKSISCSVIKCNAD